MKTRDRILEASLQLFNNEGEPNVTTVDIANEMEISPGNLYYHFRGKEVIIEELFDQFDREMIEILNAPIKKTISVEDSWLYLYVVFEHIYHYRFFYFNLTDIAQRYEKIQRRFKRLIKLKTTTARAMCNELEKNGVLIFSGEIDKDAVVSQVVMTMLYWMNFNMLTEKSCKDSALLIHQGVFQLMSLISPRFPEARRIFFEECKTLYQDMILKAERDEKK